MMQLEKNILAHSNFKYRFAEKTPGSRRPFSELVHSNVSDLFECSFLRVDTDHKVTVGPRHDEFNDWCNDISTIWTISQNQCRNRLGWHAFWVTSFRVQDSFLSSARCQTKSFWGMPKKNYLGKPNFTFARRFRVKIALLNPFENFSTSVSSVYSCLRKRLFIFNHIF